MSVKRVRDSEPSLRGEIEYLLQNRQPDFERDGECVGTAWTAEAIATEIDAEVPAVTRELHTLMQEGRVTFRRPRSGHTLWKLTDDLHAKWQEFSGKGMRSLGYA